MSNTIIITDEERDALIKIHQQNIEEADQQISLATQKKITSQARISELLGLDVQDIIEGAIGIVVKKSNPIQKPLFEDSISEKVANTLKKKVKYVFDLTNKKHSTGEMYSQIIDTFPSEKEKNKVTLIQTISKELGKNPNLYQKDDNDKDANGKSRYKYIG